MAGFGRQMDAAAVNWTLPVIDQSESAFLNFDRENK